MNKVFEHAGDLVNIRVAHNLMRLIAEGFGEEDEGADSQLRSSAVCTLNSSCNPVPLSLLMLNVILPLWTFFFNCDNQPMSFIS